MKPSSVMEHVASSGVSSAARNNLFDLRACQWRSLRTRS
jgi:hypothetical protein